MPCFLQALSRVVRDEDSDSDPDMPVDMITGLPVEATRSSRAEKLLSPEAILNAGTSSASQSTQSQSNGVERKSTLSLSARFFRLTALEFKPAELFTTPSLTGRDKFGGIDRLELHGIGTGCRGLRNHPLGDFERPFVVVADLGNNQHLLCRVDVSDFHAW
jgi:hypothetical protein